MCHRVWRLTMLEYHCEFPFWIPEEPVDAILCDICERVVDRSKPIFDFFTTAFMLAGFDSAIPRYRCPSGSSLSSLTLSNVCRASVSLPVSRYARPRYTSTPAESDRKACNSDWRQLPAPNSQLHPWADRFVVHCDQRKRRHRHWSTRYDQ